MIDKIHIKILNYREEIEPLGDGPKFNPKGRADVSTSLIGSYSITTDDFLRDPKRDRLVDREQEV